MILIVSSMGNWSHGQSVSNRYVVYIGTLFLCHFGWILTKLMTKGWVRSTTIIVLLTQVWVITIFGGTYPPYWNSSLHKSVAISVLDNCPQLYNPDPYIFAKRTDSYKSMGHYRKGVVYLNAEGEFRKAMINEEYLGEVTIGGILPRELEKLVDEKSNQFGWVYFHEDDLRSIFSENRSEQIIKKLNESYK